MSVSPTTRQVNALRIWHAKGGAGGKRGVEQARSGGARGGVRSGYGHFGLSWEGSSDRWASRPMIGGQRESAIALRSGGERWMAAANCDRMVDSAGEGRIGAWAR